MTQIRLSRETSVAKKIPYAAQISPHTVVTEAGEYMQFVRFSGLAFESADDLDINSWHERLNILYRNIGTPNIMMYCHTIKRQDNSYPGGSFEPGSYAEELDRDYQKRLSGDALWVNEIYLTIVYKPILSKLANKIIDTAISLYPNKGKPYANIGLKVCDFLGVSTKNLKTTLLHEQEQAEETLAKLMSTITVSMDRYGPELLGSYEYEYTSPSSGKTFKYTCSESLEFLSYLINGEWQRVVIPDSPLNEYLPTNRVLFGTETFEIWSPDGKVFTGAVLGVKEPNNTSHPGALNDLLRMPFPFVLTQSFHFLYKESAKSRIRTQLNRMTTAEDDAVEQHEAMNQALGDVTSGLYLFGDYHFNLFVYGENAEKVNHNVSIARSVLGDAGMKVTREDAANEAAFWASLPGNTADRPRVWMLSTKNFAGFCPFHNFPQGRKDNNYWGPALTVLKTSSQTPLYVSLHASDPLDPDGGSKKDVAHSLFLGPTGCGKTALINFFRCMLTKFNTTQIAFTKDYDSQLCIEALGGKYFPILPGQRSGFAPFDREDNPAARSFMLQLMEILLRHPTRAMTPTEESELKLGLDIMWRIPRAERQLRHFKKAIRPTTEDGLHMRLRKWIEDGEYAWLFDNERDTLHSQMGSSQVIGFDVTEFLDIPTVRTPLVFLLFEEVNRMMDGRRMSVQVAEFQKPLQDSAFQKQSKDGLTTWRKREAFMMLDTQSASEAINNPISRTIIEQTATKFLYPNPDANEEEYIDGLNCTETEVDLIKHKMDPGSRQFLVKQGKHSVVAELDLKGEHYHLGVLSTRTVNLNLVQSLKEQFGVAPNKWLPMFKKHLN